MTLAHEPPLQQLHIPATWTITFHALRVIDPTSIADPASYLWAYFKEDLLQLRHDERQVLLDLGWYPEADPSGTFHLLALRWYAEAEQMAASWSAPLAVYETRSQVAIMETITHWASLYES